jgi:drug/metabolite transporter (DMT)-like permease
MTGGRKFPRLSEEGLGLLQMVVGGFLISFSAVFVKLSHTGPTATGVYRNLFGGITLLLIVFIRRDPLWRGARPMLWAVLAGVIFAVDILCWHRSILYIGPGLATIIGNFQVFVLAFVGVAIFHERPSWRFFVSIPLAVLGLFLLVGVDWSALDTSYRLGVLLGLATAVAYSAYILTLRYSQRSAVRLSGTANLAVISLVTALLLSIAAAGEGESLRIPDRQTGLVLVTYGVVCGALGWIVISSALPRVDASRVGLLLLVQPTLTFIWDILFFHRPTTVVEIAGALIALGAIYLGTTGRRPKSSS